MMKDGWTWPYPRYVAHRGGGSLAPENTLAAARVGFAHGYRMFECDVKLSGDGTLMLMHDDTVERTTDGSGRVAGMTWSELSRLDAGYARREAQPQYAGEPIPTLQAIVRYCLSNQMSINIELKPCPGRERETAAAVAVELHRIWQGAQPLPLLSSFAEIALAAAREFAPELPRALLQHKITPDWPERLARLDCVAFDANYRELTADIVRRAHDGGYRVACYTPNEVSTVSELVGWGVDCIITDAIDIIDPNG